MVPATIHGKWVWLSAETPAVEEYLFFRREFVLSEMPGSAELWVAAQTFFHVYINGRHVAFGPDLCPAGGAGGHAVCVEANYYLETGRNVIAVLAHNASVTRSTGSHRDGGLWCQLDLDGKPAIWTDEEWLAARASCYGANRPRRSPYTGFTEHLDLRVYPRGWNEEGFDASSWTAPDRVRSATRAEPVLPTRTPAVVSRHSVAQTVMSRGRWQQRCETWRLCLADFATLPGGSGVYVARGFLHSSSETNVGAQVLSDNPYRLFVNAVCVREQGSPPVPCGQRVDEVNPRPYGEAGSMPGETVLPLRAGWNEIVFFEMTAWDGAAATFVFDRSPPGGLVVRRRADGDAERGWVVAGPLRTPLGLTTASLDFDALPTRPYTPDEPAMGTDGATLHAVRFSPDKNADNGDGRCELRSGEYVVYDLGQTEYGTPTLSLNGCEGDRLHLVTAEALDPGLGVPFLRRNGRQDIETVVCDSGSREWGVFEPRSFRYAMVVAGEVSDCVALEWVGICAADIAFPNPGTFECDDERLNTIAATGERTLRETVRGQLSDAPNGKREQALPDAMVQSLGAYHVFGAYELPAKCLRDFADAQYETGEILPVVPCARAIRQPQYSLFWPIWLYQHYLYSGDPALARDLPPRLASFLSYLASRRDRRGLLRHGAEECSLRNLGDWAHGPPGSASTALNALYCRALFTSARFFDTIGDSERGEGLREQARETAAAMRTLCWDPDATQFRDYADDDGPCNQSSWATNVVALYGGIVPGEVIAPFFARWLEDRPLNGLGSGVLFRHLVLVGALVAGKRKWALNHVRQFWGSMLDKGADTWWQMHDPASQDLPDAPLCYGAGAIPNAFLATEVAGLRPASPGYAAAYFNPLFDGLRRVKVRVPTVHGHIDASWEEQDDGQIVAHVHATYPLDLIPVLPRELEERTTLHLSDNVALLVSDDGE